MSTPRRGKTRDEILALYRSRLSVSVPEAGMALDIGENSSYDLVRRGEFPFRVIKVAGKMRVPTADIFALLGVTAD